MEALRKNLFGFTLLEMVIVIALLVISAAVIFPSWKGISRGTTFRSTTTLLLNSLEEARLSAIQQHTETWVVFQHRSSEKEDRYCTLQRGEDGKIHAITSWVTLPSSVAFDLTPESIMNTAPELIDALPEGASQRDGTLGVLSYNSQGVLIFPATVTRPFHLDLMSTFKKPSLRNQIIFSRATGRAQITSSGTSP